MSHASNNWILTLDCDEYVHSIDVSSLRRIMQQYPRALGEIQMKSLVQSRGVTSYAAYLTKIIIFSRVQSMNSFRQKMRNSGEKLLRRSPFQWR